MRLYLIDATESPIQRPKKQKRHCSQKKKRYTLKLKLWLIRGARKLFARLFPTINAGISDFLRNLKLIKKFK
jgi:hypothetical protein